MGTHCAGAKTEVVLRLLRLRRAASSLRGSSEALSPREGEDPGMDESCVPIRKGRVTKRSASA